MSVDVVIPTWNRLDLLRDCLDHLAEQTVEHRVYVVDNASSDGTAEYIRENYPRVEAVALSENLGFGRAINRGVAAGSGEFVVLLNNDVNVAPDFLEQIVAPFTTDAVGMVAGVLLKVQDGRLDAAGVAVDRGLGGYSYMHGHTVEELAGRDSEPIGPCGGAAAYRRSAFEDVNGFDEQIFAYSEDLDLALRLRADGWQCHLAADARGIHLGSASLGRRSVAQSRISSTSRGYIMGCYRVGIVWSLTELAVALPDCVILRSAVPLSGRIKGWRNGRRQPSRALPRDVRHEMLTWSQAMRRRFAALR